MILTIDINKVASGVYVARAHSSRVPVTEPETYASIEDAIRGQALSVPDGFAHFVEFTYGGMSTGTFAVAEVPTIAAELANRLVTLNAQMHLIGESKRSLAA